MEGASLPLDFQFHPTDEELIGYLKRKIQGLEIELEVIPVIYLYKFDPWELPDTVLKPQELNKYDCKNHPNGCLVVSNMISGSEKSFLPTRDMEWFFLCPRDQKYPNGSRTNRATKAGYWKANGKYRRVVCQYDVTGYRKTLVFYRERAPLGARMDGLCMSIGSPVNLFKDQLIRVLFALCRIVKRNEPKASNAHGEPKAMRVGNNLTGVELTSPRMSNEPLSNSGDISCQTSYPNNESRYSSPITFPYPYEVTQMQPFEPVSAATTDPSNIWISPDLILDSGAKLSCKY